MPDFSGAALAHVPIPPAPDPEALTPAERRLLSTLGTDQRRREWFAGRMAGRAALRALGGGHLSILRDRSGAPRLEGIRAERWDVALTHGRGHAAAIATTAGGPFPHLGLDWVDAEDAARVARIAPRVLDDAERRLCGDDPKALMVAWGVREAIAKAARTGMFVHALSGVRVRALDLSAGRAEVEPPGATVRILDGAAGALVVIAALTPAARAAARRGAGLDPR